MYGNDRFIFLFFSPIFFSLPQNLSAISASSHLARGKGEVSYCIVCIMKYINLTAIYPWSISIIAAANGGDKCCFRFQGGFDKREHAITAPMIGKDYRVINEFNNKFLFFRKWLPCSIIKPTPPGGSVRYFAPYLRWRDARRKTTNFHSINSCFN